jgi:hypothetical protein
MRKAPLGTILVTCLWMTGCAYGIAGHRDEASAVADARYVTFFVLPGSSSGSMMVDRQLKADIETELGEKGLVATSPEEAQAVVIVHTATRGHHSRHAFYQGWGGGWDWRLPDALASKGTDDYKVGTLVVDVFDAWTKKLLWHGSASNSVIQGSSTRTYVRRNAAARIFRNMPLGGYQAGSPAPDTDSRTANDQRLRIIFSPVPALLVRIDGEPTYEPVTGTDLQRVINTTAVIVRDVAGMHYFRRDGTWMEADEITGPWSRAGTVPAVAEVALQRALTEAGTDLFASAQSRGPTPVVYVSTTPAELIITEGEPQYAPFNRTPLLYIRNTTGIVFREPTDRELYVRVPTGWFRAWTTNGPWEPVPEDKLPTDLAGIRD